LGGYISDKFGGERVIFFSALAWSTITFMMPSIIRSSSYFTENSLKFIVSIRILNGAFQGVYFPSMISITSKNLCPDERTSFFGLLTSGSAIGTLFTGILGSFILDYFGWSIVFRVLGLFAISWTIFLRFHTLSGNHRTKIINLNKLCSNNITSKNITENDNFVPWLKLFCKSSFWACVLTHACEMNCFFVLLSWLPTYFHDAYPEAKGWVVNMIPWLALPPSTFLAKYLTTYLLGKRNWKKSLTRKIIETICFFSQNCALFLMSRTTDFHTALACMTIIIGGTGFHNNAVTVNPQDLAPDHSGSVFGLMNTVGAIPGFLGVYLAGHLLELTQSWPMVFCTAALVNFLGWFIFVIFGSADPII